MSETQIAAERAALESMTPMEVDLEYTRVLHKLPPEELPRTELIEQLLAQLRQDLK